MSGVQVTPDDIATLRAEGSLRAYIDALTGRVPKSEIAETAAEPYDPGPLHTLGAWPAGTRTDRPTCHPDCGCTTAPPAA
jgi:hypothetical protein